MDVHDYIDGRLSGDELRAFEKRMERDPELARTVERYRENARSLREATTDLPPGFYARARARFEASRPSRPAWRWLASWEATGVAVAALLVAAIVFPQIRQRYLASAEPARVSAPSAPTSPRVIDEPGPLEEKRPTHVEDQVGTPEPEENESSLTKRREPPPVRRQSAASPDASEDRDTPARVDRREGVARGVSEPEADDAERSSREKREAGKDAEKVGAARVDRALDELDAETTQRSRDENKKRARTEGQLEAPEPMMEAYEEFAPAPPSALAKSSPGLPGAAPLPVGIIDAGAVVVIDDSSTWDRIARELPAGAPAEWSPDFANQRVVLVGPRPEPIDCSSVRWRESGGRIVIESGTARPAAASPGGCALLIPAGPPVDLRLQD